MENGGLLMPATEEWVKSIDPHFIEVNPEIMRHYMRHHDLYTFAMLIDPTLTDIVVSSAFEMPAGFDCHVSMKGARVVDINSEYLQIEYYAWLFYEAVGYRKRHDLAPLIFHINYLYEEAFCEDLKNEEMGPDTTTYVKLMMRQSEGYVALKLYSNYELYQEILSEDDLNLN